MVEAIAVTGRRALTGELSLLDPALQRGPSRGDAVDQL